LSLKNYKDNEHSTYTIAYSYRTGGKLVQHETVSYEKDPLDALMRTYKELLITHKPEFQMWIARHTIYKAK
jgi:hypothetical protein